MISHLIILALIMFLAGVWGGWINYLLEIRDNKETASRRRSLIVGIGASFLVPLFVTMFPSSLMATAKHEPEQYFVFAGFCLIASISSSAFIRTLSDRILNAAKKATTDAQKATMTVEEIKEKVQPLIDKETELDPEEVTRKILGLNEDAINILSAFEEKEYTWRSISGISKATGMDKDTIIDELEKLEEQGFVISKESPHGNLKWALRNWELIFSDKTQ